MLVSSFFVNLRSRLDTQRSHPFSYYTQLNLVHFQSFISRSKSEESTCIVVGSQLDPSAEQRYILNRHLSCRWFEKPRFVQALCIPKAIHCIKLIDRYRGERSGMHSAEVIITSHKMPSLTNLLATRTRTTFSNDNLHSLPTFRFDQSACSSVKRASLAKTQGLLKLDLRTHV